MDSRRTIAAAGAVVATSAGLYPVFSGGAWFWAGAGAAVSVAAVGTLTRLRRLPAPVCLLGGLAGLLLYLNLVFAHSLLPTPASLSRLWTLAGQGISESSQYAPPAPELAGIMVLAAGGIGLAAVGADLIAVRLGSAALAGLPLLALFTAPFTLSVSRGWVGTTVTFCLAAGGYLTLLGTEGRERVREWERRPSAAGTSRGRRGGGLSGGWLSGGGPNGGGPNGGELSGARPNGGGLPGGRFSGGGSNGGGLNGSGPRRRPPDTSALATAGRRVGVASIVVALCVPLFVPGLHETRLFGGGPGAGGGVGFPDPQSQLGGELRTAAATPVLTYTSTDGQPDYLQVYVLAGLTAHGWATSPTGSLSLIQQGARLPAPPGLAAGTPARPATTHVSITGKLSDDMLPVLPAPYPATAVNAAGNVRADRTTGMLLDIGTRLAGLRYAVTSLDVIPDEQALAAAPAPPPEITDEDLRVPSSYAALRGLAQAITAGATTPYAKAIALQNWFADGSFVYTLNAPPVTDAASLEKFVDSTRSGYCQQFASAMAVLARLAGIPSRVAYGFTQGTRQAGGGWLVTTHDAHAWPELYFQGAGWLRFEPTPAGAGGQGTATAPAYTMPQAAPGGPAPTASRPNQAGTAGVPGGNGSGQSAPRNRLGAAGGDDGAPPPPPPSGPSPWQLAGISLAGLLAVLAALPGCARAVIRRRRWRRAARPPAPGPGPGNTSPEDSASASVAAGPDTTTGVDAALADAAWRELRDDLRDYRAGAAASETPRALARRVTEELKLPAEAAAALRRITLAAERARYSARPAGGAALREDAATVRRALASSVPRRRRWLARVFPLSVMGAVTDW